METNTIPRNLEAEGAVIGSMVIDPECISDVTLEVGASDFYLQKSRLMFEAIHALYEQGKAVDFLTIKDQLEKTNNLEKVGGEMSLSETLLIGSSALNAVHYARIVHEAAMRRALIDSASKIAKLAYNEDLPMADVIGQAEGAVFEVRSGQRHDRLLNINDVVANVSERYEAIERGDIPAAISTGYTDIDKYMTGWRRGELTLIAARPGIGKTALLTNMALKSAKAGHGTLFISGEMAKEALVKRMIQAAGVENFPGSHSKPDWAGIYGEMASFTDLPLWIDDTPNPSALDIRAKAMRLSSQHRIDHIFVDYIQLMRSGQRIKERYLEIGQICLTLKQVAREMDNSVIAASQLSRLAEGVRPTLNALKESGSQEEHSDNVIFINRERETDPDVKCFEAEIIIEKQRNGPTGTVKLGWYPSRVSFVPIAQGGLYD